MIATPAVEALDQLYLQALRDNCPGEEGADSHVAALGDKGPGAGQNDLVVLNISSYHFRLVNLLHFNDSPGLRAALGRLMRSPTPLAGNMLADAYGELANMICGAVNRGLCAVFHHAGMSTPLALDRECLAHFDLLAPSLTRHFEVAFAADARFWLSSSLHLTPGAPFDFHYQAPVAAAEGAGELELF